MLISVPNLVPKLIEESLKLLNSIILKSLSRILHPEELPLEIGDRYWSLRDSVLNCELFILRVLNFDVSFECPHQVWLDIM